MKKKLAIVLVVVAVSLVALSYLLVLNGKSGEDITDADVVRVSGAVASDDTGASGSSDGDFVDGGFVRTQEPITTEEVDITEWPLVVKRHLDVGRYKIAYTADAPLRFIIYTEDRYNQWQTNGQHTISKATTKSTKGCCSAGQTFTIDVNNGESGTYYLVFSDEGVKAQENKATSAQLTITKIGG